MIQEDIKKLFEKAIATYIKEDVAFSIDVPGEKSHGDFASNVALVAAKKIGKNPRELAGEIITGIKRPSYIKEMVVAGPGFINIFLADNFFISELKKVRKNPAKNIFWPRKKIIIEYTDPNPFKEFHIGHLMNNAIGESLSRIQEWQGAKVKRANYQGDVGLHVAKAIWGRMQNPELPWGQCYAFGAAKYEEDEAARKEIVALNKKIYEKSDKAVNILYEQGRKESLAYFETIYKKLGTQFDFYFFESEMAGPGKKLVEENVGRVFEIGEKGAIIFKGEQRGLHTRVFVNSEGLPTYEAKELVLAKVKYRKYAYDTSVIVTANEINEYFKVLMAAMREIFPELEKKTVHIGHGILKLPSGKMSSRTGKVVTAESLISHVKALVMEKIKDRQLSDGEKETIAEQVAIGAIKYSILRQSIGSDVIFDFEKSISFEGDSGPYLQYAYTRAGSVLRKASGENVWPGFAKTPEKVGDLEKQLVRFGQITAQAAAENNPHVLTLYLTQLASVFNHFYATQVIVDKTDPLSPYNVAITQVFFEIMKQGLWMLGIAAPEKM